MTRIFFAALGLSMLISPSPVCAHYTSGVEHVDSRGAAFLASPFFAAFDPTRRTAPPLIYRYPVSPPQGKCRWERQLIGPNGMPLRDATGQPVREYIIAPCERPPY